jgi:cobalt/nickel transport protein
MKNDWKMVFGASLLVGGILSLFASSSPDGLEKVAETEGFLGQGKQLLAGFMPDYVFPGIHSDAVSKSLAGVFGVFVVFSALFLIGRALYRPATAEDKE